MSLKVLITEKATKDLSSILIWYDQHSVYAADRFLSEIDHSIKKIQVSPSQYKTVTTGIQRCLLCTFPFIIYFSQHLDEIVILRFRHKKQKKLKRFK